MNDTGVARMAIGSAIVMVIVGLAIEIGRTNPSNNLAMMAQIVLTLLILFVVYVTLTWKVK